nr:hypothetical protein [Tanacetum cinerariifolium]
MVPEEAHHPDDLKRSPEQVRQVMRWIRSAQVHENLQADLIEHLSRNDLSKKKRHDFDASGSKQTTALQSLPWKKSDTREAPFSSSKQQEEGPKTPEPNSIIPPNNLPKAENNYVNALAKSYKDPEENKLLSRTADIESFIKWFYKRIGKKKLSKSDLEGPAFNVVKAFHENSISLQFQMEECYQLLTNQVDLVNPKGHRLVPDVSKLLPLRGPLEVTTTSTRSQKMTSKICIRMVLKICICFISDASSTTYMEQTKFIFTTQSTSGLGTLLSDNVWETCNLEFRVIRQSLTLLNQEGILQTFDSKKITPLLANRGL